ncbi:MAG TPA: hypothetical protein VI796_02260 [Candidatus Thermoplasmatota archaeon]|nr:hypothetical protein [Candidatus Thermoplasmatota archaeon]
MEDGRSPWYLALWRWLDLRLQAVAKRLQRTVRWLRAIRALLVLGILLVLASAVVGLVWPRWFPIAYAVAAVALVIPLVALAFLVALPLRARSVVRLIDKGYPGNAKELAIRMAARKLHEESIATEELLVDTAINEGRKAVRKWGERARRLKEELDASESERRGGAGTPPPRRQDP